MDQNHAINVGAAKEHFILDYGFITHHARYFAIRSDACTLQYDASGLADMTPSPLALQKRSDTLQNKLRILIQEVEIWSGVTFIPPPH